MNRGVTPRGWQQTGGTRQQQIVAWYNNEQRRRGFFAQFGPRADTANIKADTTATKADQS